jgi:uncharacterized membrane protein (UPF0127 family)
MTSYRRIIHAASGQPLVPHARWCDTFASKLRGFTFRRTLPPGEGLVLVEKQESRLNTSIHMFFVFFDLGVLWVDSAGEVVDKVLARPWRPSYVPRAAARYVVETNPEILNRVQLGDRLRFEK